MCCNNYAYGALAAYSAMNGRCGCYGSQNSGCNYGGNLNNASANGTRQLNFIVSANVAPYNPCYINPYTGCAVPYDNNNGCGCHNNCCR